VDLKQDLMDRALRLMQDPRILKAIQNPMLMQGLLGAVQLRAKMQQNVETGVSRVAKRLNLATGAELRELRRTVRRLERELAGRRRDSADSDRSSR
jgi:hypothetical protein